MFLPIILLSGTAIKFRVGKQPKNYAVKKNWDGRGKGEGGWGRMCDGTEQSF